MKILTEFEKCASFAVTCSSTNNSRNRTGRILTPPPKRRIVMSTNGNGRPQNPQNALQPLQPQIITTCTVVFWTYWIYDILKEKWKLHNESRVVGPGRVPVSSWDNMQRHAEGYVAALRENMRQVTGCDAAISAGPPVVIPEIPTALYESNKHLLEHCVLAGMREGYLRRWRYPIPRLNPEKNHQVPDISGQFEPGEEPEEAEVVNPAPTPSPTPA